MRARLGIIVGGVVAIIGSVIWAVSLAIYQQRMEPSGIVELEDGTSFARMAENNTYWPREMRELAIVLALGAVLAIGRASVRAWAFAAALGVVWLAADLWLDRIDIDGRTAAVWLAVAGCIAVTVAAVVARGGSPSKRGALLAGGTAAFLALAPAGIGTPRVEFENAVTIMDLILVVGLVVLAVTLLVPVMVTARSRWLVSVLAAVIVAVVLPSVVSSVPREMYLVAPVCAMLMVVAAQGLSLARLLVAGGVGLVLTVMSLYVVLSFGVMLGGWLTRRAGNPPVSGADTDLSIALTATLIGLALCAAVLRVVPPKINRSLGP